MRPGREPEKQTANRAAARWDFARENGPAPVEFAGDLLPIVTVDHCRAHDEGGQRHHRTRCNGPGGDRARTTRERSENYPGPSEGGHWVAKDFQPQPGVAHAGALVPLPAETIELPRIIAGSDVLALEINQCRGNQRHRVVSDIRDCDDILVPPAFFFPKWASRHGLPLFNRRASHGFDVLECLEQLLLELPGAHGPTMPARTGLISYRRILFKKIEIFSSPQRHEDTTERQSAFWFSSVTWCLCGSICFEFWP